MRDDVPRHVEAQRRNLAGERKDSFFEVFRILRSKEGALDDSLIELLYTLIPEGNHHAFVVEARKKLIEILSSELEKQKEEHLKPIQEKESLIDKWKEKGEEI